MELGNAGVGQYLDGTGTALAVYNLRQAAALGLTVTVAVTEAHQLGVSAYFVVGNVLVNQPDLVSVVDIGGNEYTVYDGDTIMPMGVFMGQVPTSIMFAKGDTGSMGPEGQEIVS